MTDSSGPATFVRYMRNPLYTKLLKSIGSRPDLKFRPLYAIIRYIQVCYMRGLL